MNPSTMLRRALSKICLLHRSGYALRQGSPERSRRAQDSRRQLKSITLNAPSPVTEQPEVNVKTKRIVEAILFAAKRPMTAKQVQQVFPELEQPELQEIQAAIEAITEDYNFDPLN